MQFRSARQYEWTECLERKHESLWEACFFCDLFQQKMRFFIT